MPFSIAGVSVALPGIAAALHGGIAGVQWVINGYDVAFASLMLALGSLADILGRRRVFTIGVTLFAAGAAVCAFAPDMTLLNLARFVSGSGAAAALTAGSALLADVFTGAARARAFGLFGTSVGLGLTLSPTLAGLLVNALGWRSVFAVPAIIGAVAVGLTRLLPESRNPSARRVDWIGTATFTGALGLFVLALIEGPQTGWGSLPVVGGCTGFVLLMVVFVIAERKVASPMFDLRLLAQRRFLGLCLVTVGFVTAFTPLAVDLPSYFIAVNGIGALQAGMMLLLLGVPTLVFPTVAGYLTRWIAPRHQLVGAILLSGAGAVWLTMIHPGIALLQLAGPLGLIGAAIGISFGLLDAAAVSSVPAERAGMAAGMFNTTRLGGETIAIAVVGSLLVSLTSGRLAGSTPAGVDPHRTAGLPNAGELSTAGVPTAAREGFAAAATGAYTGALHTVCLVIAVVCVVAGVMAAMLLRERRTVPVTERAPAERIPANAA
jgi:Na+/melibiose symporter-like transporter